MSEKKTNTPKEALRNTLYIIGAISTFFLGFKLLADRQNIVALIGENIIGFVVYSSCFVILFIIMYKFQPPSKIQGPDSDLKNDSEQSATFIVRFRKYLKLPIKNWRNLLKMGGVVASVAFILLAIGITLLIIVTDAHYVVIASEPNEKAAVQRIEFINKIIAQKGVKDIKARAYSSSGKSHWYMITINRSYFTWKAANETLILARKKLGNIIPADAYIYTSSKISISKRLKSVFSN